MHKEIIKLLDARAIGGKNVPFVAKRTLYRRGKSLGTLTCW